MEQVSGNWADVPLLPQDAAQALQPPPPPPPAMPQADAVDESEAMVQELLGPSSQRQGAKAGPDGYESPGSKAPLSPPPPPEAKSPMAPPGMPGIQPPRLDTGGRPPGMPGMPPEDVHAKARAKAPTKASPGPVGSAVQSPPRGPRDELLAPKARAGPERPQERLQPKVNPLHLDRSERSAVAPRGAAANGG